MSRQPAVQFGKYQLLDLIAVGGMAEIYRAVYTGAAGVTKPVVIKKILPHYAGNPTFVSMFINEAKIALGLSHGNVAQIFDFGEIDGEYFLAMEYVHGQPLSKVLKRARAAELPTLPAPIAVVIALEVCRGLHYAHTRVDERGRPLDIIHRDVSPQNVLISYEGQVKLVDFGIAKARHASQGHTEPGAVKGKYAYFSPEQALGEPLDARTDVFATGVVLYEMLCGRVPFEGKMVDALSKLVKGDFPRPRALNPEISPALERIVLTAMAQARADRYPHADAFQEALRTYLYTHAPTFSAASLSHLLMSLFEPELIAEGRPIQLPREFVEQLTRWRKPAGDNTDPGTPTTAVERIPRTQPGAGAPTDEEQEALADAPTLTRSVVAAPKLLLAGVPVLAMVLAAGLVVASGRLGSFTIRVTSQPPGATVRVDGAELPSRTPVVIPDLEARRPHRVEVLAPGMRAWAREVTAGRGAVLDLEAALEPVPAPKPPPPEPVATPRVERASRSFRLVTRTHGVSIRSRAARLELDPRRAYRIWTEGEVTVGGRNLSQALVFLDGKSDRDRLGLATGRARVIRNAARLYAFVLGEPSPARSGALSLRVQDVRTGRLSTLRVVARAHTLELPEGMRLSVSPLDPTLRYEVAVTGGRGEPRQVVFTHPAEGASSATSTEPQGVWQVGGRHVVSGHSALHVAVVTEEMGDDAGDLELEVTPLP